MSVNRGPLLLYAGEIIETGDFLEVFEDIIVVVALHFELVVAIYLLNGHFAPALDILLSLLQPLLFLRGLSAH